MKGLTITEQDKFKSGDCCYVVDIYNKIKFCNVIKEILGEPGGVIVYQVQDVVDWRYMVVEHVQCAESESEAKQIIKRKRGLN